MTWPFFDAVFDAWTRDEDSPTCPASFNKRFTQGRSLTLLDPDAWSWMKFDDHIFSQHFNKHYKAWGGGVVVGEGDYRLIKGVAHVRATYTLSPNALRKHTVRLFVTTVQMHGRDADVVHAPQRGGCNMSAGMVDGDLKKALLRIDDHALIMPELAPENVLAALAR